MKLDIDLRDRMKPIGDQGIRPTCVAFALTACHEFLYSRSSLVLSKDSLHWGCVKREGSAINGVNVNTAIIILKEDGQHLEADWTYTPNIDEARWESLQPPNLNGKPKFKILKESKVKINAHMISDVLIRRGPIFVVVPIYESFYFPKNGKLSMPDIQVEEYRGLHAVCIVGVTEEGDVMIRNSWGIDWGSFGYSILPFEYLKKHASFPFILINAE